MPDIPIDIDFDALPLLELTRWALHHPGHLCCGVWVEEPYEDCLGAALVTR